MHTLHEGFLRGLLSQILEAGCFYVDTRKFDKGRLLSLAGTWGKASEVPLPLPQQSPGGIDSLTDCPIQG